MAAYRGAVRLKWLRYLSRASSLSKPSLLITPKYDTYSAYVRILPSATSFINCTVARRRLSTDCTFSDTDFKDLKFLLSNILKKRKVPEDGIEQNLAVVDVLYQHRLDHVDSTTVKKYAENMSPSDIYMLASNLFTLKDKVGEEAVCLSVPLFRLAAMGGDVNGKYSYAQLLRMGQGGLSPDPFEAGTIFDELAKLGHPHAQFALAGMYYTGVGVEQNYETAFTLYQVSTENGIHQAHNVLGKMYLEGQGVVADEHKAFEHFQKGADDGDIEACISTAHCYTHGKGTEKNNEKAFEYHSKAAAQGHPVGLYNAGTQYFAGKGVVLNMEKAAEFFQKAADKGFHLACVNLGNMYYHGLGVEKDWNKAKDLYSRAAPNNHNARLLLEELESEMKTNE